MDRPWTTAGRGTSKEGAGPSGGDPAWRGMARRSRCAPRRGARSAGSVEVPGDKSVSHRALILGALAVGETRITGLLEGQDVLDTAKAMQAFGAEVERTGPGAWRVSGVGVGGFQEPEDVIDHGNAGTGVRLVMGAMATTDITATFTGDASLRGRPMGRITDPLALFGAEARGRRGGRLPITLTGAANPTPVTTRRRALGAGEVGGAPRRAERAGRDGGDREGGDARPYRADARRLRCHGAHRGDGARAGSSRCAASRSSGRRRSRCRATRARRPFRWRRRSSSRARRSLLPGIGLTRRAPASTHAPDMGADIAFENRREEGGEPVADLRVRFAPLRASRCRRSGRRR